MSLSDANFEFFLGYVAIRFDTISLDGSIQSGNFDVPEYRGEKMETDDRPFGIYDDDGNEINTDLIAKPSLCVSCSKDEDPAEEVLCLLNRADQQGERPGEPNCS